MEIFFVPIDDQAPIGSVLFFPRQIRMKGGDYVLPRVHIPDRASKAASPPTVSSDSGKSLAGFS